MRLPLTVPTSQWTSPPTAAFQCWNRHLAALEGAQAKRVGVVVPRIQERARGQIDAHEELLERAMRALARRAARERVEGPPNVEAARALRAATEPQ